MDIKFDHAVILVSDLREARQQFEALGFYVEAGGDHGFTENALITFRNSSYIELIAVKSKLIQFVIRCINLLDLSGWSLRARGNIIGRLLQWFSKPYGPIDWCVRNEFDPQQKMTNISITKPREFSRHKPDSRTIKWTLSAPCNSKLPMFIKDITPHKYRSPDFREGMHKNGAHSIEEIILSEHDFVMVSGLFGNSKYTNPSLTSTKPPIQLGSTRVSSSLDNNAQFSFGLKISYSRPESGFIQPTKLEGVPNWLIFISQG